MYDYLDLRFPGLVIKMFEYFSLSTKLNEVTCQIWRKTKTIKALLSYIFFSLHYNIKMALHSISK